MWRGSGFFRESILGFTVCFIVCIMLRKGLNGRMTMFYFHTMFTFQEPAHYLPLWRASCRSLLPQQGCTQNAEGLVLPTRCRFGWFDDVCLGTSKTQLAKTTLCIIVYALKTLKHRKACGRSLFCFLKSRLWNLCICSCLCSFASQLKGMAQPPTTSFRVRAHAA